MAALKSRREFLAGASACALLLAGCDDSSGNGGGKGSAADAKTLNRGNAAEPLSLDPHHVQGNWEFNIVGDLIIGLTTEGADGHPIPGAAERWESSEDGKTWTFFLRDHRWSDGMPVTADDFVYAWQRILDPKSAASYAYFLYPVKNAEAVNTGKMKLADLGVSARDAKTFVVEFDHPLPYLLEYLMHFTTYPVPRHLVEAKGDTWSRPGTYVGNGPYVLTEWNPNERITLVKNPQFYDAANVRVETVVFYPTTDYVAALKRFRVSELDEQDSLPAQEINWIKTNIPESLRLDPWFATEYLVTNLDRKPFDDLRIRQALSLAIDRETIVNKIGKLGEPAAYAMVPPGTANYPGNVHLDFKDMPMAERVKRAQDLMRQAGFGPDNPFRTSLMIRSASTTARRVPAVIQQMWTQIYVDAQILQLDAAIFYARIQTGDFDIANPGWVGDFNDASSFLDLARIGNSNNYGHYNNPAYDKLLDEAAVELDLKKRGELLAQAEGMALHDGIWIPLSFTVSGALVKPYVKGWLGNILNIHRTRWLSIDGKGQPTTAAA